MSSRGSVYNQVLNLFWTALGCLPFLIYWIGRGADQSFYIFLALSFVPVLLPRKVLNLLRISRRRRFYEKLGIRTVRRFVQDGDIIRKAAPVSHTRALRNVEDARKYLRKSEVFERYHLMGFVFFTLSIIEAIGEVGVLMLSCMVLSNLIYNVLPVLLQQYTRGRISRL